MERRELGRSGLLVSAMGLGCMGMSQSYGPGDDDESIRTIHRALDIGVTFLDTAAIYGAGINEQLVGKAIKDRRGEVTLATKCGILRGANGQPTVLDGSPAHILASCEESLQHLMIDDIDLFYLHRVDPKTPIEESVEAMAGLVRAGKVRHIGLSEAAPSTLRRAHAVYPITALQSEYSLWFRDAESSALPVCRELGIGFVPFSPLGRGFLTGTIDDKTKLAPGDFRNQVPRFSEENRKTNLAFVDWLKAFAARKNATPAQIALAWLLAQRPWIVPIPGTTKRQRLEENLRAASIQLTPDELRDIDRAVSQIEVHGARYTERLQQMIGR